MYFIIASFLVSIVIFALAKFLDYGSVKREKTLIELPKEEKSSPDGVKIEIFDPTNEDLEELGKSFARSFLQDPFYCWLFTNEKTRFNGIAWLKSRMVGLTFPFSNVLIATKEVNGKRTIVGMSAWEPPGHASTTADFLRQGILKVPFLWSVFTFVKLLVASRALDNKEKIVKRQNYWYLSHLHVDPAFQGKGFASKLMRPVLDKADATNAICLLTTGNPKNVPIYEKFGFALDYKHPTPGLGGPPIFFMCRRPKKL